MYSAAARRYMILMNRHRRQVMVGNRIAMALEKHAWMRAFLLNFVLLGTCALIGDGILTPAISRATPSPYHSYLYICIHAYEI